MAYLRQVYSKKAHHDMSPTQIGDFVPIKDKVPVANPAQFFRDHGHRYFVCCADFQTNVLVLVRPKEIAHVKRAPFFNQALQRHVEELLVIPFSQLADVATEVAGDIEHITTIFLHMTTRCGSTLLTKALGASGAMHTVSQSDVYSNFTQYVMSTKEMPKEDVERLLGLIGYTNTLFNYSLFREDPSKTISCYKMHGQVCLIADLLKAAIPDLKSILLYRSLIGTVDSYAHTMVEGRYWKYWLMTTFSLDNIFVKSIRFITPTPPWDDPMFASAPVPHGIVWFCVYVWLTIMQKAHELTKHDAHQCFDVVLRYEELCEYREEIVVKVMDSLGINYGDEDAKRKIRAVFGVNSQAGHPLAGRGPAGGESWIGEWEMSVILKILEHVNIGRISQPDFVLNGTIKQT